MRLTETQNKAIEEIQKWLKDENPDDNRFLLYGAAGTGKTTVLKEVINLIPRGCRVGLTAPTHKAVGIFSKMMFRKGVTLHSLMGLRPNLHLEDFSNTNPRFTPIAEPSVPQYDILIHDETSMLSDSLDERLVSLAKANNVKILYVGDKYQLPPIKAKQTNVFNIKNKRELLEIVRQEKGNPLLEYFSVVRDDVKNGTMNMLKYIKENPSIISEINGEKVGYKVVNNYEEIIHSSFAIKEHPDNVRSLAFTNEQILNTNKLIRQNIFNNSEKILVEGDIVTGYTTLTDEANFYEPILTNSSDYIVLNAEEYVSSFGIDGFIVELQDIVTTKISSIFVVNHLNTDSFVNKFYKRFKELRNRALTIGGGKSCAIAWAKFYEFKNFNMVMTNISDNGNVVCYKDLDYGYGLSVHKAQGSTYKTCNIDLRNIMYGNTGRLQTDITFMNKLIYVAMSRAQNYINIKI